MRYMLTVSVFMTVSYEIIVLEQVALYFYIFLCSGK